MKTRAAAAVHSPGVGGSAAGSSGARGNGGVSSTNQWVLGYYTGYQSHLLEIDQFDWSGLTHVALAPMLVKADHTLDFDFSSERGTGEQDAKASPGRGNRRTVRVSASSAVTTTIR